MKVIVIAGGGRRAGKTTLARALREAIPSCQVIKLGTHLPREDKEEMLFPRGTPFSAVCRAALGAKYLVIESGTILDNAELRPDLIIFLPAPEGCLDKPGSARNRARADLIRGEAISASEARRLASQLGFDEPLFLKILDLVGVRISEPT